MRWFDVIDIRDNRAMFNGFILWNRINYSHGNVGIFILVVRLCWLLHNMDGVVIIGCFVQTQKMNQYHRYLK